MQEKVRINQNSYKTRNIIVTLIKLRLCTQTRHMTNETFEIDHIYKHITNAKCNTQNRTEKNICR